jgi:hypothetical protein
VFRIITFFAVAGVLGAKLKSPPVTEVKDLIAASFGFVSI